MQSRPGLPRERRTLSSKRLGLAEAPPPPPPPPPPPLRTHARAPALLLLHDMHHRHHTRTHAQCDSLRPTHRSGRLEHSAGAANDVEQSAEGSRTAGHNHNSHHSTPRATVPLACTETTDDRRQGELSSTVYAHYTHTLYTQFPAAWKGSADSASR